MKRITSPNPNQLEYREGGGCLALFGLPFGIMGGLAVVSALLGNVKTKGGAAAGAGGHIVAGVVGGIFALIGLVFIFGRYAIVFDKGARTLTRWWGLLIPMKTITTPLSSIRGIELSHEIRRNKNNTYSVYPVRLQVDGGKPIDIETSTDQSAARTRAEEIAEFLQLALTDSSSGETIKRDAGTLQESLRDRIHRTGEEIPIGSPPAKMRSVVSQEGETLRIEIPPPSLGDAMGATIFALGCGVLVFGGFLGFVTLSQGSFPWPFLILLPFFIIGTLGTLSDAVKKSRTRMIVKADPAQYSQATEYKGRLKEETLPAGEIEEVRLETHKSLGLALITDKKVLHFGEGLSRDELEFLRGLLVRALTK